VGCIKSVGGTRVCSARGQLSDDNAIAKCRWYAIPDCMRGIRLTRDGIAGAPGWVLSHDTMYSSNVHQQQLVPHCPCRRYVLDVQQATCHHLNIYTKHFSETLSCSMSRGALKTKQGFSISPCHCPGCRLRRLLSWPLKGVAFSWFLPLRACSLLLSVSSDSR